MKYIEQVKSVVLILLILFSLTLTFAIWTYSPVIPTDEGTTVDISIAEKKKIEDVIKPYRMIVSQEDGLKGTFVSKPIESVLDNMKDWEIQEIELANNKVELTQINDYINTPNRASFFFTADVPFEILGNILNFADQTFPDSSFNRLIIDWNENIPDQMIMYFINTSQQKLYTATADNLNISGFTNRMVKHAENMQVYNEIIKADNLSLYVSSMPENIISYTYSIKEIGTDKFKDALFNNPSLVRSNPSTSGQQYSDDSALMSVDFSYKILSYVHPASENENPMNAADLIQNSLRFVNEHNGWTDDYRYSRMNADSRQINYQLYFDGLPVFSRDTTTEISQKWGTDRVYQYLRPLYTLNVAIPFETREVKVASGQSIYNFLSTATDINLSNIDDIITVYYLSQSENQSSHFTLEPAWYYLESGSWILISPDLLGGEKFGLE